ncbi:MAG TPA: extracellular solute-binding protein, partial [Dehalococcoidia bacterium]|nr:extracellular solute-binding protein [Dehalococcoidia bacterium]
MQSDETSSWSGSGISRRLSRRQVLAAGAGLVGASLAAACTPTAKPSTTSSTGAASGGTTTFKPPQGASLNILVWSHFVPAYDTYLDQYVKDWGTQNNVKVNIDHVDINDIDGRLAAEVAARKGHDLFGFAGKINTILYEKQLVDWNDLVNGLIKQYGDPIKVAKGLGAPKGSWLAVPDFGIMQPPLVRADLLKQYGLQAPTTWDEVMKVGTKLKANGHPCGFAVSQCNDANHNWRTVMNAFGASEVGPDGKTITADSKEMREFLQWAQQFAKDANNTPEVYAWDNASDNRYLASGAGGFIHDAISGLRSIQPDNKTLYDNIDILAEIKGPARQIHVADYNMWAMWNFTPQGNQEAAKAFVWDYSNRWKQNDEASTGYNHPLFTKQYDSPMPIITADPKYKILEGYKGELLQSYGYPGPANGAAQEVLAQYVIPNMVAKAMQGSVDDAVK